MAKAATVAEYLASLPEDRRAAIGAVRKVILANLDKDYEEGIQYGMIGYYVPHRVFPAGYHCDPRQPLPRAGLASQKGHMALYLMCVYGSPEQEAWFRGAWAEAGKKLDMGKSCVRFKRLEDVPLEVIGEAIRRVPAAAYVKAYQSQLEGMAAAKAARKAGNGAGGASRGVGKRGSREVARRSLKKIAKKAGRGVKGSAKGTAKR